MPIRRNYEAILAMGHIFIVHFFIESYRPRAFPLNDHIFHGAAPLDEMAHEHPAWIARLRETNTLEDHMASQPPRWVQAGFFGFGIAMIALGLALLAAMIIYAAELSV